MDGRLYVYATPLGPFALCFFPRVGSKDVFDDDWFKRYKHANMDFRSVGDDREVCGKRVRGVREGKLRCTEKAVRKGLSP